LGKKVCLLAYLNHLSLLTSTSRLYGRFEAIRDLRDVLANYQATIKSLLLIQDFPGVTPEELELFKREFRTSAYTCRLPSCPRATAGFDTNELRLDHEATHTQRLQCLYPGCQYPPFTSTRALKNHENKCHQTVQGRKSIRRVEAWPQHNRGDSQQAYVPILQQSMNEQLHSTTGMKLRGRNSIRRVQSLRIWPVS
jgi:hypothetical protein